MLVARYGLPEAASERIEGLLATLAAEPDPHTTVVEAADALDRHIADSLSGLAVPGLQRASTIADLGAGAGFPGLPLALALPDAQVDLIEAATRKTAVIVRLIQAAGLENARVVTARAEDHARDHPAAYSAVTARAVAALPVLVEYAAPLLEPNGLLVAWKGRRDPDEERSGASAAKVAGLELREVVAVTPFEGARDRHLHVFEKVAPTPDRLPRRPGMAVKRPLGS